MRGLLAICLSILISIVCMSEGVLAVNQQPIGQWTTIQGSNDRMGRADISGGLSEPELLWELDLGVDMEEIYISLVERDTDSRIFAPNNLPLWNVDSQDEWGLRIKADLAASGELVDITSTHYLSLWGQFLDDTDAYQKISFSNTWAWSGSRLQFTAVGTEEFSQEYSWEVSFSPVAYNPMAIVVDIDGDGINDIVVSHWYGVTVYDIYTGDVKYQNMYRDETHARQYGHLSSFTLPDGRSAILVVGDRAGHIAVLAFEEKNGQQEGYLDVLWYYTLDDDKGVVARETMNIIGPNPVSDFDGNGQVEIIMNIFNEYGDQRWHLMVYDALTGEVRYDVPDLFVDGSLDITGDGYKEWIGRRLKGGSIKGYSELVIVKPMGDGLVKELWSYPRGNWSVQRVQRTESFAATSTSVALSDLVSYRLDDTEWSVVSYIEPVSMLGGERLTGISYSNGQMNEVWSIEGGPQSIIEAVTFSKAEGLLVKIQRPSGSYKEIAAIGGYIIPVARRLWRESLEPQPLVLKDDNNDAHIIIATPNNLISCYVIDTQGKPMLKWQYPGRLSTSYNAGRIYGLTAGDVNGDGIYEVIYVTESPRGGARVIARGLDGVIRWYYDLPHYSGNIEEWNVGMITHWMAGNFLDHNRTDVFISGRQSNNVGMLINTDDNSIAWELPKITTGLSHGATHFCYGGGVFAAGDYMGDGLEDIVLNYPSVLSVVAGTVGMQLYAKWTAPIPDSGDISIVDENILIADLNNDGVNETLLIGNQGIVALRHERVKTETLWKDHIGTTLMPAVAIHDGKLILGVPSGDRGFRALDAATGDLLWQIAGTASSNSVTVDINGDGNEEFVYIDGIRLKVKAAWNGELVWEYELPKAGSNIVMADTTGDNNGNILVSTQDGFIYCLGSN